LHRSGCVIVSDDRRHRPQHRLGLSRRQYPVSVSKPAAPPRAAGFFNGLFHSVGVFLGVLSGVAARDCQAIGFRLASAIFNPRIDDFGARR
jgi:hypothetical protein